MPEDYLLDDFARNDGQAANGARWRGFSDRVMGGISRELVTFEEIAGRRCIRLRGEVRLERNGGFIQVALPLDHDRQTFDAHTYAGLRLLVYGNSEEYYVHLRTSQTWMPWQYFRAPFHAKAEWQTIVLPFSDFQPVALGATLDRRNLKRVALVAYGRQFQADLAVAEIAFTSAQPSV
jgi:hypothetical protein